MTESISLFGFFVQASWVVKLVLLTLISASIFSWTIIVQRGVFFQQAKRVFATFEKQFWGGADLSTLYAEIGKRARSRRGIARVFHAGFDEYLRVKDVPHITEAGIISGVQRAMRVESNKVLSRLEQQLPWLATIGSVSPFVGLFGTVWGIMTSFQALGNVQQATIAMIAPGISEALIATAVGLFAAIPAVIAYNRYVNYVNEMANQLDTFQDEFIAIIQQKMHSLRQKQVEPMKVQGILND